MSEVQKLLERQAAWQRSGRHWSWEEKVRFVEQLREEIASWSPVPRARGEEPGPTPPGAATL